MFKLNKMEHPVDKATLQLSIVAGLPYKHKHTHTSVFLCYRRATLSLATPLCSCNCQCHCHCSRCLCIERDNKNELLPTVALFIHWQCHANRIARIFYVGRLAKIQFIYYQQRNIANITQESNNNNWQEQQQQQVQTFSSRPKR